LLARAVWLLKPAELPALRVPDPTVFDVVLRLALQREERTGHDRHSFPQLQAVGWSTRCWKADSALKLVKRCAGTLKELDCPLACEEPDWNEALARCTRLESLASAKDFAPAAWLGLSQLHTLLGVCLGDDVSVADIAAALPRLHTLGFKACYGANPSVVAGFFGTLLPRLRSFRFSGEWPSVEGDATTISPTAPPYTHAPSLPLLKELIWESGHVVDGFSGAKPQKLCAPSWVISLWTVSCTPGPTTGCGLLSRVHDLRFHSTMPQPSSMAAALQAAPELRTLHGGTIVGHLQWRNDPAFAGLVHRKLRSLRFSSPRQGVTEDHFGFPAEYDMLRAHHFPRLHGLTLEL
jgi:hypothetical protein